MLGRKILKNFLSKRWFSEFLKAENLLKKREKGAIVSHKNQIISFVNINDEFMKINRVVRTSDDQIKVR